MPIPDSSLAVGRNVMVQLGPLLADTGDAGRKGAGQAIRSTVMLIDGFPKFDAETLEAKGKGKGKRSRTRSRGRTRTRTRGGRKY